MKSLVDVLYEVYGVGPVVAPPVAVLWASDLIEDPAVAKKEIKKLNRMREGHGAIPVYVPYGHRAF